jgi:CDP-diacylglycerol--serine O-phosphatidyltransferase
MLSTNTKLKNIPNMLTICNMAIGIFVILLLIYDKSMANMRLACYLIYVAVILDVLDGFFARLLNATSQMGKQLDSFADFVTFGVSVVAVFVANMNTVLDSIPWYALVVLFAYPLAGAFRLARFNLQKNDEFFMGLPITAAGFFMNTLMILNLYSGKHTTSFIVFGLAVILVLSLLMVSNFKVSRLFKIRKLNASEQNVNL